MRGTKNPDLNAILALEPDVVIANKEENRELDVRRLRDSGVQVWVSDPKVPVEEIDRAGADVVLLPDEPYVFTDTDGPEAFDRTRTELVSGRLVTWYGPSLVEAHRILMAVAR